MVAAAIFFFIVVIGWVVLLTMMFSAVSVIEVSTLEARGISEGKERLLVPVCVAVYYETLCPYSQMFITKSLLPAYRRAPQLMNLSLVPYGNARTKQTPEGYEFTCQHGPRECEGNRIHSCALEILEDQASQLEFVACMMRDETEPATSGQQCADRLEIPWELIEGCAEGPVGRDLLYANGVRTMSVKPRLKGVPTIRLNGVPQKLRAVSRDLMGEVCKMIADPKPEECLRRTNA